MERGASPVRGLGSIRRPAAPLQCHSHMTKPLSRPLKTATTWRFLASAPPREVFATMEQLLGVPPYQFRRVDDRTAEIVEVLRLGVFGNWTSRIRNPAWARVVAEQAEQGTLVEVTAAAKPWALLRGRRVTGAGARALQLVKLLTQGGHDYRTVYRDRRIPPGPVTLVASWAGTPYRLFLEPRYDAPRGAALLTASRLTATGQGQGPFIQVLLPDGGEGWLERDQCVAAPGVWTREAQVRTAVRSQTY
ncbi:MAG: hypothetical protein NVSMB29_08090 [Candidatus Dormibacteria bacterium]